jgi:hypothetical protein
MLRQRLRPSNWRIRSLSLGGAVLLATTGEDGADPFERTGGLANASGTCHCD